MISPAWCVTMAQYNRWMNGKLYAAAATLPGEARKRDLGAFFKSLHGTLDHLLWGDTAWLARFTGGPAVGPKRGEYFEPEFDTLRVRREALDGSILDWAGGVAQDRLDSVLHWTGALDGKSRALPYALCVTHFFNHQTHHRGQASTLLMQLGIDPGVTDLPALPELKALA